LSGKELLELPYHNKESLFNIEYRIVEKGASHCYIEFGSAFRPNTGADHGILGDPTISPVISD